MISWLIENTVFALLLSGGVVLVTLVLRPRPAICHVLWLVVLLKLVTPPILDWSMLAPAARAEVQTLYAQHVEPVVVGVVGNAPTALPAVELPRSAGDTAESAAVTATGAERARAGWTPSWTQVLTGLWILGSAFLIALLFRRVFRMRRLLAERQPTPAWLVTEQQRLCRSLGVAAPELVVLPGLATPCTGGLRRTRVFWPAAMTGADDRGRVAPVLAHELAHVRRWDHVTARFELLAALVYWWHPLFWFVRSRMREYAEQDCDARALALSPVAPRAYAETLLGLRAGGPLPPAALSARPRNLRVFERRLAAVMRGCRAKLPRAVTIAASALLVLLLPSWANGPEGLAAAAAGQQNPEPGQNQDPEPLRTDQKPIGRIAHVAERRVTVRLDDGIEPPKKGARLWIAKGKTVRGSLAVMDIGDGVFLGHLNDDASGVVLGDKVWAWPARDKPSGPIAGAGTVLQVAGRIVTIKLEEGKSSQPIKPGQAWGVFEDGKRVGEARVQLVEREFVFFRFHPEGGLQVGTRIALGPSPVLFTPVAEQHGPLGKPIAAADRAKGTTLVADYSDNRVVEIDADGNETHVAKKVYGAWDAERLANGNLLLTEFSVSKVREVDATGKSVWEFDDLKNPYDADRLPNGNTLIADTFGSRVVEVDPDGDIVWEFAKNIRPFDVDRLANGNTLIADVLRDRVIEVDRDGKLVWEVRNLPNAHDADRLANGSTLVTLRTTNQVVEISADGKVVFTLANLNSPSDADRLSNGNTLVAENGMVREFDPNGEVVWKKKMTWAVEVNRY